MPTESREFGLTLIMADQSNRFALIESAIPEKLYVVRAHCDLTPLHGTVIRVDSYSIHTGDVRLCPIANSVSRS